MKKVIACLLTTIVASAELSVGQCNSDGFVSACIPKLLSGFNFLKGYKIESGDKDKVEYSYVFTKGTQYMINLCTSENSASGIMISIFDSGRNKVASSKIDGEFVSAVQYSCGATGIYYIQYTFADVSIRCGGSALGFKR